MKNWNTNRLGALFLACAFVPAHGLLAAGPDKLVGTWTWTWKDGQGETHKHVLEVAGSGEKLSASEKFDALDPIKVTDLKIDGKTVTFTVKRGERRSSYNGTLDSDDEISGKVTVTTDGQDNEYGWDAKREPVKK